MPADPYANTRLRAALQTDEEIRRDEPVLWWFVHVTIWLIHPWKSLQLWWLERTLRR